MKSVVRTSVLIVLLLSLDASAQGMCPGDLSGDGRVDESDLGLLLQCWGHPCGDLTGDGTTNESDLGVLLQNWLTTCVGTADLDVDSDNTNGTSAPDRSILEDQFEDTVGAIGKCVLVNDDDDDNNGVPDKDLSQAILSEHDDLVPIVVELQPAGFLLQNLAFRITYPPTLRLWRTQTRGNLSSDVVGSGVTQNYVVSAGPVTFWVEGLAEGAALGDARLVLEADTDSNATFEVSDAVRLTTARMSIAPSSGILGTQVTVGIAPAVGGLSFTAASNATWSGLFRPLQTPNTGTFQIAYDAAAFHEVNSSTAVMVIGEGQLVSGNAGRPGLQGLLDGDVAVTSAFPLRRSFDFTMTSGIVYVEGGDHGAGGQVQSPRIVDPSAPGWGPYLTLETAYSSQVLVGLLVDRNAYTSVSAPIMLDLELVSLNAAGVEVGRAPIQVFREARQDFGPNRIVYYSNY